MNRDFNNIKQWLLPILQEKQLSIEQLARAAGLTRSAVYYYMNDRNRPTRDKMAAICNVLNIPVEEGLAQYTERPIGRPKGKS